MTVALASWLRYLATQHPQAIDLGLSRVDRVRAQLNLSLPMPVLTVGGTNGKGSVCALAEAILSAAGVHVGCYTSPHLLSFNERVRLGGVPATDEDLVEAFTIVDEARQEAGVTLTYFEFTTLAAAWLFARARCDAVVLEVGLGGRLDAVNVFEPATAVITSVGFDHMEFLGDTIDSIAREKAGILRPHKPAVAGFSPPELIKHADDIKADLWLAGRDFGAQRTAGGWHYWGRRKLYNLPAPALRGTHQIDNAAVVLAALERLPSSCWPGSGAIRRGLHHVDMPARGQVLPSRPLVVLDVAHNAQAAVALEKFLFDMGYFPRTAAVLGMLARKDAVAFVRPLLRRIERWYVACPQEGDMAAATVAEAVRSLGGDAVVCHSVAAAAKSAADYCGDDGRVLITGSFMTVADYMQNVDKRST